MSGIVEFLRGEKKVPKASDDGLAKAVGQVLKNEEPRQEMVVKQKPLPWDHKSYGPKLSEFVRQKIAASKLPDIMPSDAYLFTYQYEKMPRAARVEFWAHFWARVAKFECSYNPAEFSVDVGHKDDKNTWSVGLLQMSVCDQPNYGFHLGFKFEDLQDPFKNFTLALPIAQRLLLEDNRICGKVGEKWKGLARYWGTLRDNESHQESYRGIITYMQAISFAEYPMPARKIGVIVGHDRDAKGAKMCQPYGRYEYDFNKEVAYLMSNYAREKGVECAVILRDDIGISGAYKSARAQDCEVVIELHFNSYNGKAYGTETLSSSADEDKALAVRVQNALCKLFDRHGNGDRGVKITDEGRGAQSCVSFPGKANCLVEPGFGDNASDAKALVEKKVEYAKTLVDAMLG